jgi:hypothetical protein
MASFLYTISTLHCMSVSLASGGPGLGTAWGHQVATRMLEEAGFKEVKLFERVDPFNSVYVAPPTCTEHAHRRSRERRGAP